MEIKLLFGGEMSVGWHWGANLVFERVLGGDDEHEYALTAAISRSLIDSVFSLGFEAQYETVDVADDRFSFDEMEILVGPSLQWSPVPPMHIDLVTLFGAAIEPEETTPITRPLLVAGWEF